MARWRSLLMASRKVEANTKANQEMNLKRISPANNHSHRYARNFCSRCSHCDRDCVSNLEHKSRCRNGANAAKNGNRPPPTQLFAKAVQVRMRPHEQLAAVGSWSRLKATAVGRQIVLSDQLELGFGREHINGSRTRCVVDVPASDDRR